MRPRAGLRSAAISSSRETTRQAPQNERSTTIPFDPYRGRRTPQAQKLDWRDARPEGRLLSPGPVWGPSKGRLHSLQARTIFLRPPTDPLGDEGLSVRRLAAKPLSLWTYSGRGPAC